MWPSAAVMVSSGPIGAAPCDTHGSISTPSRRTPTAPAVDHLVAVEQRPVPLSARARGGRAAEQRQQRRRVGEEAQDGVGGEGEGVGEQDRAGGALEVGQARQRAGALLELLDRRVERQHLAVSPNEAAHTETAVPVSTSRASLITPPAPQPISVAGASISWTAASVASGAARCAPEANSTTRSQERSPSPRAAADAASSAPARASGVVERPVAMCTLTRLTILRPVSPPASLIAIFGPTGVGKTEVALALAERLRAEGEDPVAISADALQVYEGLATLTGAAGRGGARAARAPAGRLPARHRVLQRRRLRGARARRDRRRARRRAGGRSSSAAPASTCAPRSPTSTCARRPPPGSASAGTPS